MNKRILVPLVTPFREDESVDYEVLKKLVKYELDEGADGIYVGGSSAECYLLNFEERKKILETVVRAADGAFVVANIGSIGTLIAEEMAMHAKHAGADAISSVPPFYFGYTFAEVSSYYKDLVKKTKIPLMLYNIPANTKRNFTLEEMESLLKEDYMDYLKFTDTDFFMMEQLKSHTGKTIYSGKDENFLSAVVAGADGGIGTSFNFMSKRFKEIQRLALGGEIEKARNLQHSANEVIREVCACGLLPATKYLMELLGIACGRSRRPFEILSEEKKMRLQAVAVREKIV